MRGIADVVNATGVAGTPLYLGPSIKMLKITRAIQSSSHESTFSYVSPKELEEHAMS